MRPDQVIIYLIDPSRINDSRAHLTEEETERANCFRSQKDADHWAACRTGLRLALAPSCGVKPEEVPIWYGTNGKPMLAPPFAHLHFNLSHCSDLALVAVAATPVGIDIERSDRAPELLGCEETFCHPDEQTSLPPENESRAAFLLEIWTSKESVLKALGTGFFLPPEEVMIHWESIPGAASSSHEPALLADLRTHRLGHAALANHTAFVTASAQVTDITFNTDFI